MFPGLIMTYECFGGVNGLKNNMGLQNFTIKNGSLGQAKKTNKLQKFNAQQ